MIMRRLSEGLSRRFDSGYSINSSDYRNLRYWPDCEVLEVLQLPACRSKPEAAGQPSNGEFDPKPTTMPL